MSETNPKTELSKEVLAPADSIREDLVATAVKFLQNPKVQNSPFGQKKAFLQRKGLTSEEIAAAVKRAGISQSGVSQSVPGTDSYHGNSGTHQQAVVAPFSSVTAEVSRWVKAREVLLVVTMVTGLSYAAYRLYKEFLCPWLFGVETSAKRVDKLEKIVAESVVHINSSLTSIEETLGKQEEKLQMLSHDVNSKMGGDGVNVLQNKASISEIKAELSSLKGLLLNRRQFPAMPSSTPVLPAWQLASNSGDATSNSNNRGDSFNTDVPKITLSSSPAPEGVVQENSDPGSPKENKPESDLTFKENQDMEVSLLDKNASSQNQSETGKIETEDALRKTGQRSDLEVTEGNEDTKEDENQE